MCANQSRRHAIVLRVRRTIKNHEKTYKLSDRTNRVFCYNIWLNSLKMLAYGYRMMSLGLLVTFVENMEYEVLVYSIAAADCICV